MLKRLIGALLDKLEGETYEKSRARYEAASGRAASSRETSEFEAVAWMLSSGGNPGLALQRFERESMMPDGDLEEGMYEAIRGHLRRWCRQIMPSPMHLADGSVVFDAAMRHPSAF